MSLFALVLTTGFVSVCAGATGPAELFAEWRNGCQALLDGDRVVNPVEVARSGDRFVRTMYPLDDADLGKRRYVYGFSDPVPNDLLLTWSGEHDVTLHQQITAVPERRVPRRALTSLQKELTDVSSKLGGITVGPWLRHWTAAFAGARVESSVVTHAARILPETYDVLRATIVKAADGRRYRVSEVARYEHRPSGLERLDTCGRFERLELLAVKPSREDLKAAARTFLALTSPSLADLELTVGPVAVGYIVGFKRNPLMGIELRPIEIRAVARDRFVIENVKFPGD